MAKNKNWGMRSFMVQNGAEVFRINVKGRMLWALQELFEAGERGCTPITEPAPRWSDYVFKLRCLGVDIETIHEHHFGPFAGTHAR